MLPNPDLRKPLVFSPVKHRYSLAAQAIPSRSPIVLDIGGYRSRAAILAPSFDILDYTAANIGTAWYGTEAIDVQCDGAELPFPDQSYDFVISVDTIEHIPKERRRAFVQEAARVARLRTIIVAPFLLAEPSDEADFLATSADLGVAPMPSLQEHQEFGLPTLGDLESFCNGLTWSYTFHSPRRLYWSFQTAMLVNTAVLGESAEFVNRKLYDALERALENSDMPLTRAEDAYRVVLVIDALHSTSRA